jgi:hypothetical protein
MQTQKMQTQRVFSHRIIPSCKLTWLLKIAIYSWSIY